MLNLEELKVDLTKLKEKRAPKIGILPFPSKILTVYSLQLAKCHFENGIIIVQVKVPLKIAGLTYKVFGYSPIPLLRDNTICQLANSNFVIEPTENRSRLNY